MGGVIPAIEQGFLQREIAEAASAYQKRVDEKKRIVVGVNEFVKKNEQIEIPILEIGEDVEKTQVSKLNKLKSFRDNRHTSRCLNDLTNAARTGDNVMPFLVKAAKSYATLGEMVNAMKRVYGEWTESEVI